MNVIQLIERLTDLNRDGAVSQHLIMVIDEEHRMYSVRQVAAVDDEDGATLWIQVESY